MLKREDKSYWSNNKKKKKKANKNKIKTKVKIKSYKSEGRK